MKKKNNPIFIHSLFRTGSTYLWNKFRQSDKYYCFYEPLHPVLAKVTPNNLEYMMTRDFKAVHHPKLDRYYLHEYIPLLKEKQTGIPYFKKEFSYDQFFMGPTDENPELKQYIDYLLGASGDKIPVLKFNRTAFRTAWFKKNYPDSLNIYIIRNPRHQWQSYHELYKRRKNNLFFLMDLIIACINKENEAFRPLTEIIPLLRFSNPIQDNENDFYRIALGSYTDEEKYSISYYLWFYAIIENVLHADFIININLLSRELSYKNKVNKFLRESGIDTINFADTKIEEYSQCALPVNTMDEIEKKVQNLLIQSLTEEQIDCFFREISPEDKRYFKFDPGDFIQAQKKKKYLPDFRKEKLDKLGKVLVQLETKFSAKTGKDKILEIKGRGGSMEVQTRKEGFQVGNTYLTDEEYPILQKMGESEKKDILLLLKDEHLKQKDMIIAKKNQLISQKDEKIQKKCLLCVEKNKQLKLKDAIIAEKNQALIRKDKELREKDILSMRKDEQLGQKDMAIAEKDRLILQKNEKFKEEILMIGEWSVRLKQKEDELKQKDLQLLDMKEQLSHVNRQLQKISNSWTYCIAKILVFPAKLIKKLTLRLKNAIKKPTFFPYTAKTIVNGPGKYKKKINLSSQLTANFGKHRSGLKYGIYYLNGLHNPRGALFDAFIERTFCWNPEGIKPHLAPWIGIIHVPPKIPKWFNYHLSNEMIFKSETWQESLPYCKGLFTLSEYHRKNLEIQLKVPINSLFLPTEFPREKWTWDKFTANNEKKLIQVGWWLRKLHAIYQLPENGYKKIFLNIGHKSLPRLMKREKENLKKEGIFDDSMYDTVETINFLSNKNYDKLLGENLIFIYLYDSSANNIIVECIARNTPILINPIEAVKEYLGEDYPLYYDSLEEAVEKAADFDLLYKAHQYLTHHSIKHKLTGKYFLESFANSQIYRDIKLNPVE